MSSIAALPAHLSLPREWGVFHQGTHDETSLLLGPIWWELAQCQWPPASLPAVLAHPLPQALMAKALGKVQVGWEEKGLLPQGPAPSLHVVLRGHGCLRSPGLRAAGNWQSRMPTASPPVPSCPAAGPKLCGSPDCPQPGSVREAEACPACTPPLL